MKNKCCSTTWSSMWIRSGSTYWNLGYPRLVWSKQAQWGFWATRRLVANRVCLLFGAGWVAEPSGSLHAVKQSLKLFNTEERTFSLICTITCHFISFTIKGGHGAYRPTDAGVCVLMEASAAYQEPTARDAGSRRSFLPVLAWGVFKQELVWWRLSTDALRR